MKSTRKQILQLGIANGVDALFRFFVPILLVRILSQEDYGYYRYFWLLVSTMMIFAPMGMSRSLLYFLPRSSADLRVRFVSQTLLYLVIAGLVASFVVSPWSNLLSDEFQNVSNQPLLVPGFILLWVVASLIDILPSAEQDIGKQAVIIMVLTFVRSLFIVVTAYITRDVQTVYLMLLVFAALKATLLVYYYLKRYGAGIFYINRAQLGEQLRYAVPFGLTGTINKLRRRVEQWVVALYFTSSVFAVFSIVVSVSLLMATIRRTIGNVIMPKMSRMESSGDTKKMLLLNSKANVAIAAIQFPISAFIGFYAEPIVTMLYTDAYAAAAPVLKIYVIGLAVMAIEMSTVLMILKQGRFVLRVSIMLVVLSIVLAYLGAQMLGLVGVAIGSVVGILINNVLYFSRAKALLGVRWSGLQEWNVLFLLGVCACVSAWLSGVVVNFSGLEKIYLELFMGGGIFVALYAATLVVTGHGWIIMSFLGKGKWRASNLEGQGE